MTGRLNSYGEPSPQCETSESIGEYSLEADCLCQARSKTMAPNYDISPTDRRIIIQI